MWVCGGDSFAQQPLLYLIGPLNASFWLLSLPNCLFPHFLCAQGSRKVSDYAELFISSFQFSRSVVSDSLRPHGLQHARPPCPSPTPGVYSNSNSIELVMPSNHLIILCHPFLLLPSVFPSIRVFSNESALHIRWTKYWSFSFNISPCNEHSGPQTCG